jgi:prephenate dehydrogenase
MANKISIIGLGQIGASIGMALKRQTGVPKLVGFDSDTAAARAAEILGAVDARVGLAEAVRDADIVFVCLPLGEVRETLKRIGPMLKDEAVILDTAPIKSPVMQWAREIVPPGRYYLGLVPAVNTEVLAVAAIGVQGARDDLFKRTVMVIVAPPNTPAEVEQLGINVAKLLGAKPLLADVTESDGIMTTAHLLPQLASAALLEACTAEPGWVESRKLAGRPFAGVTGGMAYYDDPASLEVAALANQSVVVHALDVVIAAIKGMRDDIERGDQKNLSQRLSHSFEAREKWLDERGSADWLTEGGQPVELPGVGEQVMQMLFGSRIVDRTKIRKLTRR